MNDIVQQPNGIFPGRVKADFPPGTVVFLIGMRINRFRSVRKWLPQFLAMPKMLRELFRQPDSPLLGARTWMGWRVVMVQQYWRSMDELMTYAQSAESEHLPAWKAFNLAMRGNTSTGVWHEAYVVQPEGAHNIYVNMPAFGMSEATSIVSTAHPRVRRSADREATPTTQK